MTVLAHIDKLRDFMEYWDTLHTSLEKEICECPDWVQETRNALDSALDKAEKIRNKARRALDRAYEQPEGPERQQQIERCEQAYEHACRQYEKVDEQLSVFVRDAAQYTQTQQEILADIKALQKKGTAWLADYTARLKEAKLAITGQFSGGSHGASGMDAGIAPAQENADVAQRTIFEITAFIKELNLEGGDPSVIQAGGVYRDVKKVVDSSLYEVHHIPPQSVFTDKFELLPTIALLKEDHAKTSSYRGKMNKSYHSVIPGDAAHPKHKENVHNLAEQGMFAEAVRNEIFEIRETFGTKYDGAIGEYLDAMLAYIRCNGVPTVKE